MLKLFTASFFESDLIKMEENCKKILMTSEKREIRTLLVKEAGRVEADAVSDSIAGHAL